MCSPSELLQHCSVSAKCQSSAQVKECILSKRTTVLLYSFFLKLLEMGSTLLKYHTAQQTSLKRLTGKEKSTYRVSSSKLTEYTQGTEILQGGLGLVSFCSLTRASSGIGRNSSPGPRVKSGSGCSSLSPFYSAQTIANT